MTNIHGIPIYFKAWAIVLLALLFSSLPSQAAQLGIWGSNTSGQLGLGNYASQNGPVITDLSNVAQIAGGYRHTLALMNDGTVTAWGDNFYGQLGIGSEVVIGGFGGITTDKNTPTTVSGLSLLPFQVKQVAAGRYHSMVLMIDGTVRAFGSNAFGQLGLGDFQDKNVPKKVPGLSGVKKIVCGWNHTLFLMSDGTVRACGKNDFGQLGLGSIGGNKSAPQIVFGLSNVKDISAGYAHTVFLMNDATVKVCGWKGGPTGGWGLSELMLEWGNSNGAQLAWQVALGIASVPTAVPGLSDVRQIAAGADHTVALVEGSGFIKGIVKTWGWNFYGQLGLGAGNFQDKSTPTAVPGLFSVTQVAAGYAHSVALKSDGTVTTWGFNHDGQLGDGNNDDTTVPKTVIALIGAERIAAGGYHTLVLGNQLKILTKVKAWGHNKYGQLGLGDNESRNTPTIAPQLFGAKQIAAGFQYTLILMDDGTVWACGHNDHGQLGLGYKGNIDINIPTKISGLSDVKQVTCYFDHSLALMKDGTVKAWGSNDFGKLGLGSLGIADGTDVTIPTLVPNLLGVRQISAAQDHTLALMNDGTVKAWGTNSFGELGLGNQGANTQKNIPTLIPVLSLSDVRQIVGGFRCTLALLNDGTVKAWGANDFGQLGLGENIDSENVPTSVGLSGVRQLVVGQEHVLALMNDGTVQGWGASDYLGLGNINAQIMFVPTPISGLSGVKQLAGSMALMNDGTVKIWGLNWGGDLGLGPVDWSEVVGKIVPVPTLIPNLSGIKQIAADASMFQGFAIY